MLGAFALIVWFHNSTSTWKPRASRITMRPSIQDGFPIAQAALAGGVLIAQAALPPSDSPPRPVDALPPSPALVPMRGKRRLPPPSDCDDYGECQSVTELARQYAVDNTLVVTFGNDKQAQFSVNWVYHMQRLGVKGLLVGMMNMNASMPSFVRLASRLRASGVGVYLVNSPEVRVRPQGGRWTHVLPLLRTGVRLLLSDSDAVWLRNPLPYLLRLEHRHPKMDFAVSTDAQDWTDGRRLGSSSHLGDALHPSASASADSAAGAAAQEMTEAAAGDLDIENFGHCWWSMNIGLMYFAPAALPGSGRPGAVRAIEEAISHMSATADFWRSKAIYVDQGPMNFRWKHGSGTTEHANGSWRWRKQLHAVSDASGQRLCGLVNGSAVAGVLPTAQFTNGQTFQVFGLPRLHGVVPFVVHAVWIREQRESNKLMRLREAQLWADPPEWYAAPAVPMVDPTASAVPASLTSVHSASSSLGAMALGSSPPHLDLVTASSSLGAMALGSKSGGPGLDSGW